MGDTVMKRSRETLRSGTVTPQGAQTAQTFSEMARKRGVEREKPRKKVERNSGREAPRNKVGEKIETDRGSTSGVPLCLQSFKTQICHPNA